MLSAEHTHVCRRLRLPIATTALVATLTVAIAEAPAASSSPSSPFPGFLLDRGRYIPFEASDPSVQVFPTGINNRGEIVGEYIIDARKESIMLRDRRGTITSFDVPGAQGTEATDINDRGQIVGTYSEDTPIVNNSARPRAYVLDRFGRGKFTRIDFPGASFTAASGINNRGQVVGGYLDAEGRPHGFLWDKGRFTTIDFPGAPATSLTGINNRGQIVGVYGPTTEPVLHGFLLSGGAYATFDAPGVPVTTPLDINDRGQIVGFTIREPSPVPFVGARGFLLARGAKGPFTPIDFPGASLTAAGGIDDRGRIVGTYQNATAAPDGQRSPTQPPMMMMMMPGG